MLTIGCSTTQSIISDGKLYSGMSKESLRNALLDVYPSEDPFIYGSFSEYNTYKKKEIISGSDKKLFYVFKNVNKSIKLVKMGKTKDAEKAIKPAVNYLINMNCKKIILGCTELPIAIFAYKSFKKAKLSKTFMDPKLILAEASMKKYK